MTAEPSLEKTATNGIRTALGLGGVLSVILGIVILVWPGKTAMVVTALIAVYAIIAGLVYAGLGIFAAGKGGWSRIGHVLLGVLFVVAGIVAFTNLGATAVTLAAFLGILVGIMWIIEGVVALSTLDLAPSRGWTIFYAIISIIAGVTLLFSPLWGAVVLKRPADREVAGRFCVADAVGQPAGRWRAHQSSTASKRSTRCRGRPDRVSSWFSPGKISISASVPCRFRAV